MCPTNDLAARQHASRPRWSDVLRALREARGVTQAGWAAQIGVSRTTVVRWERGERAPDPGAEAAILAYCRQQGLFRRYTTGPLAEQHLSGELLQDLLAEARWRSGPERAVATPVQEAATGRQSGGPAAPPPPPLPPPANLPASLTSFVGREREIAAVRRALGGTRLLTLTGTGGGGKTRLALQVAAELLWAYPHGVCCVELATLSDPALVPHTVARALGLQPSDPRLPLDVLQEYLQPRGLLLLLDNCEHLLAACAAMAEPLLRTCPHLEVLATSRTPLGIMGEAVWPVPPLALPPAAWAPGVAGQDAETVEGESAPDAVRLFVERARLHRPDFALTPRNAPAVADICRRLDGVPLAIELAAARVKVLSAEQIADRLSDRFQLLTSGGRTTLPRHQTLRAALDWSYDLLTAPERALLRRLAVFAGDFTLEAVEAVGTGDRQDSAALSIDAPEMLNLVERLVDQSLVLVSGHDNAMRYRLLETVRAYAAEQLTAAGEEHAAQERHARWCLALAEVAESHKAEPEQGTWLTRLDAEHDNLRAALGWSLADVPGVTRGLALAGALGWFWKVRGHYGEGRRWLTALLTRSGSVPPGVRAKALNRAGVLAMDQGDHDEATRWLTESLALARQVGDEAAVATCLNDLGILAGMRGEYAHAWVLLEEGLGLVRARGDRHAIAAALGNLGITARRRGEIDRAVALYEECLTVARALGNTRLVAMTFQNLGNLHLDQHAPDQAAVHYHEGLALCVQLQDRLGAARCLGGIAEIAGLRGDARRAVRLCGAATALREAIGVPLPPTGRSAFDRTTAAARAALGEAAFRAAWAAGQALSLEDVSAEALTDAMPA
jgi:predicted ATPase/transcriptional regulator with XRE-family HTH domain